MRTTPFKLTLFLTRRPRLYRHFHLLINLLMTRTRPSDLTGYSYALLRKNPLYTIAFLWFACWNNGCRCRIPPQMWQGNRDNDSPSDYSVNLHVLFTEVELKFRIVSSKRTLLFLFRVFTIIAFPRIVLR